MENVLRLHNIFEAQKTVKNIEWYGQVFAAVNNRDGGLFAVKSIWLHKNVPDILKSTHYSVSRYSTLPNAGYLQQSNSLQIPPPQKKVNPFLSLTLSHREILTFSIS